MYWSSLAAKGAMRYRDVPGSLGVLESPDNFMPIGHASCWTHNDDCLALFILRVGGRELDGLRHLVGGEFVPA